MKGGNGKHETWLEKVKLILRRQSQGNKKEVAAGPKGNDVQRGPSAEAVPKIKGGFYADGSTGR
jgi:hypothetical protein